MQTETKGLEWTVERACKEFGPNPRTLANRLVQAGIKPNENGTYTTKQIAAAVFGDIDGEKLRKVKEEADKIALDNAKVRGDLISVEDAAILNQRVAFAIRQKILALPMPKEKINELLYEIQRLAEVDFTKIDVTEEDESN